MAKKILLVTNIFPPHIGGPASFVDRIAHYLSEIGHQVSVVCSSDLPREESDRARPFKVIRVCLARREIYEIKVRLILFWEFLRHRNILVNGLEYYSCQVAQILNRKYVLKVVGDVVWETARNRGTTVLDMDQFQVSREAQEAHRNLVGRRNRFIQKAQLVFTPSEYMRQMVVSWGVDPQRVRKIYNGIDNSEAKFEPLPRSENYLHVVFVGRLTNWKGVETLLLALASLENVKATIVGDGPEYPHLVELAQQLRLNDKVRFAGRQPSDKVRSTLRAAHALVLPSLHEGLSHTLLEACSLGVPCIASDRGGNPEVIADGISGLLVSPQDVSALRDRLKSLRENEEFRIRLAKGAKRRSTLFAIERTVKEIEILMENINGNGG